MSEYRRKWDLPTPNDDADVLDCARENPEHPFPASRIRPQHDLQFLANEEFPAFRDGAALLQHRYLGTANRPGLARPEPDRQCHGRRDNDSAAVRPDPV